jgi:hypothetical protein
MNIPVDERRIEWGFGEALAEAPEPSRVDDP